MCTSMSKSKETYTKAVFKEKLAQKLSGWEHSGFRIHPNLDWRPALDDTEEVI